MVYAGFILFILASIVCVITDNYVIFIIARILQGVGLSSPRSIAISMIRDTYSGDYMAKIISIVVMFFILLIQLILLLIF